MIDLPVSRSIHNKPVPRGAGLLFVPAVIIGCILFSGDKVSTNLNILISILLIWFTGLVDDLKGLSPKIKFLSIGLAVLIVYTDGFKISTIHNFAHSTVYLGILSLPFTYFAVAGFTNAFNLIDGIDALAGSVALLISIFFAHLGYIHHDLVLKYTSVSLLSALTAFLLYNRPSAKLFMGDSGSLTLGFMLSILFIEAMKYIDAVSVLYLGALPVTDTLVSMLRRSKDGQSLISADKCHLHHIILALTGSVYKTLSILISYQILMMFIGYFTSSKIDSAYMLILYLLLILLIYCLIIYLKNIFHIECYYDKEK